MGESRGTICCHIDGSAGGEWGSQGGPSVATVIWMVVQLGSGGVIHCHIVAAALHYFNMTDLEQTGRPSVNANQLLNHSEDPDLATKWNVLKSVVGDIIDNYVILKDFVKVSGNGHGITQS